MNLLFYTLDDEHNVIETDDVLVWARWFENIDKRRVAADEFTVNGIDYRVSTVFIGIDHNHFSDELHIFETMVFSKDDGEQDIGTDRCSTWEQAEKMHSDMVAKFKRKQLKVV